jgi:cellobiose phosphorylase
MHEARMVDYGHFSEDGREYVITRFPTPRVWENFIGNREYGLRVGETGAGYSLLPIAPGNRITYPAAERGFSKAWYLRDEESGQHWSLTWQPTGAPYERFLCRHGLGYTVFEMNKGGIETSLRVFVPLEGQVEIWTARIRNASGERRRLTVFPYVEWYLGPYMKPWDNYRNYIQAHWVEGEGLVVATLAEPAAPGKFYEAFARVAPSCSAYDTEREVFVGSGSISAPGAVVGGRCRNSDMPGDGAAIAAFAVDLELAAGQEQTVTLLVGFAHDAEQRRSLCEQHLGPEKAEEGFSVLRAHWERLIKQPQIETPEPRLDRMANIWLKANILQLNRTIREGMRGYRDTLQDAMGVVSFDGACARENLLRTLSYQCAEGHAPRQYSYDGGPHDPRVYNDSPLWIVLAVARYLKETGDFEFLEAQLPFFGSDEEAAVFEHVRRAVDWIGGRRGWHDLIRIDRGDWCDAFDQIGREGKGVSVWLSQAFHLALLEFADMCALRQEDLAVHYRERAAELRASIEENAWDGQWYLAAISDSGRRLGAKGDRAMEIYLNSQSWSVIGRVASEERARQALAAADQRLDTPFGPLVIAPPFYEYDPEVGRMSVLRPGCGENGTVYVHAAVFYVLANLMAGRPERALEVLGRIAPMMEAHDPEVTQGAPYAYVNSYVGPCYPAHEGRTLTNWFTSSSSWTLLTVTDWLLGVRPTYEGLLIDPCLPEEWEHAILRRAWRGAEYEVEIRKPKGLTKGETSVTVDGERQAGALVPSHGDGKKHRVAVEISAG